MVALVASIAGCRRCGPEPLEWKPCDTRHGLPVPRGEGPGDANLASGAARDVMIGGVHPEGWPTERLLRDDGRPT